jgi:protein-tyrosine-phosphatase
MAALMMRRAAVEHGLTGVSVVSAGLHASPGREAHERAQVAASELGMPLDYHRSQSLTQQMVSEADAIIAMDFENLAELQTRFPEARHKVFFLSAYADGKQRYRQIPDPYFGDQDEARRCYSILNTCIDNLVGGLTNAVGQGAARAGSVR